MGFENPGEALEESFTMADNSIRLLAALPVPETTWEPREPQTKSQHHPRGILRNASGVHPIVVLEPPKAAPTGAK